MLIDVTSMKPNDSRWWNNPKAAKCGKDDFFSKREKKKKNEKNAVLWSNANESFQINCILPP